MINISNDDMTWDDNDMSLSTYAPSSLNVQTPLGNGEDELGLRSCENPFPTTSGEIELEAMGRDTSSVDEGIHVASATVHASEAEVSPSVASSSFATSANTSLRGRMGMGRNIGRVGGGRGGSRITRRREFVGERGGGVTGRGGGDEDSTGAGRRGVGREYKSGGDVRKGFVTNLGFISGIDTPNADDVEGVASFRKGIDEVMVRGGGKESHEENDMVAVVVVKRGGGGGGRGGEEEIHDNNLDDELDPNMGGLMGDSRGASVAVASDAVDKLSSTTGMRDN